MGTPRTGPWLKVFLGGLAAGAALLAVMAFAMVSTDQRPFCASCHIMQEAAVTHKLSTHAKLACNECHAPHNLLAKLPFKAQEGLRDFMGNVSGKDIPRPLSAHPRRGQRKLQGLPLCHQQRSGQHGCQALLRGLPPQYGPHAPQAHQYKDGCL